jgi:hypothetical protein
LNDLLKLREGPRKLFSLVFVEPDHGLRKGLDAALAAFAHKTDALEGGLKTDAAAVFGGVASNQAGALEAGDDAAHRRGTNLFGIGKLAERFGSAEDQHGESRELGRPDAAFAVADAKPAQQVNSSRMELIGKLGRGPRRR